MKYKVIKINCCNQAGCIPDGKIMAQYKSLNSLYKYAENYNTSPFAVCSCKVEVVEAK